MIDRAALTGNFCYTFPLDTYGDVQAKVGSEEFSIAYPFVRGRDINSFETLYTSLYNSKETQMPVSPELSNDLDQLIKLFSNHYLLTMYLRAALQDEVGKLPKEYIG